MKKIMHFKYKHSQKSLCLKIKGLRVAFSGKKLRIQEMENNEGHSNLFLNTTPAKVSIKIA